jgi:hypothetical protein
MDSNMTYLERVITDGHAKFSGDPNNDIQPVGKEALIGAIKKCHQTLWAGGKLSPPAAFGELCKITEDRG